MGCSQCNVFPMNLQGESLRHLPLVRLEKFSRAETPHSVGTRTTSLITYGCHLKLSATQMRPMVRNLPKLPRIQHGCEGELGSASCLITYGCHLKFNATQMRPTVKNLPKLPRTQHMLGPASCLITCCYHLKFNIDEVNLTRQKE